MVIADRRLHRPGEYGTGIVQILIEQTIRSDEMNLILNHITMYLRREDRSFRIINSGIQADKIREYSNELLFVTHGYTTTFITHATDDAEVKN